MPRIEDKRLPPDVIITGIKYGAFSTPEGLNRPFIQDFIILAREYLDENRTIITILGRTDDANINYDSVTRISAQLNEEGLHVETHIPGRKVLRGTIYLGASNHADTAPEYTAVKAAIDTSQSLILCVSPDYGILSKWKGRTDTSRTLSSLSWDNYLRLYPGNEGPFNSDAAILAKQHGVTVVFLGPDLENIKNCLSGGKFQGTVLLPDH